MNKERIQTNSHPEEPQFTQLRSLLSGQPRNGLLLEMILQTSATIQDILKLKVGDLKGLGVGDPMSINSGDGLGVPQLLTAAMKKCFDTLLKEKDVLSDGDILFRSNKGGKALSKTSVSRLVRKWITDSDMKCSGIRELRSLNKVAGEDGMHSGAEAELIQGGSNDYTLPRITTITRQEAVFQELEKAIMSGQIPPGQRLSTEEIARGMGVSRIPVREALARLAERGFITTRPKWGSIVNELSRDNLREILDLRLMLECEAVGKATVRISDSTITELERINREFTKARSQNKADLLLDANRRFHILAYKDSKSPILLDIINQLWDKVSPYYNIMFRQSITTHPQSGVNFHDQLINALRHRNADDARHWVETDLIHSADFVLELFDLHQAKISEHKLGDLSRTRSVSMTR